MKKNIIILYIVNFLVALNVNAAEESWPPKQIDWPFEGIRGKFDQQAAQRGYKVYKEVCSSCHSLKLISFRNLEDIGFSKQEIKTLSASFEISDGPNDDGEMFNRTGLPSDRIPSPYPNEEASRAANNGAYPPDLSLIVKARANGANYIYSILTGYDHQPPQDLEIQEGMYYNPYFPNYQIAMAAPLTDGAVEYNNQNVKNSVDQMAKDLTIFLQWASEPEMQHRKELGIKTIIYLAVMTIFFIVAKNIIWHRLK